MAADDVARALMAMDDEAVRSRVANGDLSDIDASGLDDGERKLVQAAATDDPDVEGFGLCDQFLGTILCDRFTGVGAFGFALNYTKGSQVPGYQSFQQAKLAQGASW